MFNKYWKIERIPPHWLEQTPTGRKIPLMGSFFSPCQALSSTACAWSCWKLRWSWRVSWGLRGPPCWSQSLSVSRAGLPSQLQGPLCGILDSLIFVCLFWPFYTEEDCCFCSWLHRFDFLWLTRVPKLLGHELFCPHWPHPGAESHSTSLSSNSPV